MGLEIITCLAVAIPSVPLIIVTVVGVVNDETSAVTVLVVAKVIAGPATKYHV